AKVGQKIYLTDMDKVYQYEVSERTFIPATKVEVVNDTPEKIITLITCNSDGSRRLMIRGNYEKSYPINDAPTAVKKALDSNYTNK
ncbi:MAG: sortase, partial [Limosilactobacillus sp.]|nr:sortase [Limosilactobacillus sp.]